MPRTQSGWVAALQLALAVLTTGQNSSARPCKAVPGTPGWPSPSEWQSFNATLGGRLLQPNPPAAVCHAAGFNTTACKAIVKGWTTYDFHQKDPVSVDWNQWTNDTCLPLEGAPCTGQGYPVYVINATEPRHVQRGVEFAAKHNIRLVIKSSGHDFIGRSVAPNSLSIWTHHLSYVETHESFRPQGCRPWEGPASTTAVTVGAGTPMWNVYQRLDAVNLTTVGGGAKSVSVGGFATGGGHGVLAPKYGLAADQVLEVELVKADGQIVTANACQNQDLFWAVRGGGGSTFGALTSLTFRTFPTPRLDYASVSILTTNVSDPRPIFDMAAFVLSHFPALSSAGLSGYSFILRGLVPLPFQIANMTRPMGGLFFGGAVLDSSPEALRIMWEPILTYISITWPGLFVIKVEPESFPTFLAWFSRHYDVSPAGQNLWMGSRLFDAEALIKDRAALSRALETFTGVAMANAHLVSGKGVHDAPVARPSGLDNAVSPAWRKAYVHMLSGSPFMPFNATTKEHAKQDVQRRVQALKELTPGMGAYLNEADPEEPEWQDAFWGENYPRLLSIKREVDPNDVFWCTPCVGNERWEQVGDRLCRVGSS
ncbi:hypothetical protein VTJ83DRAFT_1503 [Remersonia thermophila]|uniref:FAD-binding PCMH-type domain-containing protein n=1 Tax=Remersonia thermophila TaxID=72144 RepID=A0ABR4DG87_9PEZI